MTAEHDAIDLDAIEARHRLVLPTPSQRVGHCGRCVKDWPCDAAALVAELRKAEPFRVYDDHELCEREAADLRSRAEAAEAELAVLRRAAHEVLAEIEDQESLYVVEHSAAVANLGDLLALAVADSVPATTGDAASEANPPELPSERPWCRKCKGAGRMYASEVGCKECGGTGYERATSTEDATPMTDGATQPPIDFVIPRRGTAGGRSMSKPMYAVGRADGKPIDGYEHTFFTTMGPDDWTPADEYDHDDPTEYVLYEMRPIKTRTFGGGESD